jgi:hypothetical protein
VFHSPDSVRARIFALSDRANVVYHELDFIPGYEFVGGHFDGQIWGGLGLVITGDRRVDGYRQSPMQTRYREPFQRFHAEVRLGGELDRTQRELERSRQCLADVQSSMSWRITGSLRGAKRELRSLLSRASAAAD